jgi:hypothetical protein
MRLLEQASQKLTKFRYVDQLTNMEANLLRREKIVNSENADLREMIEYLKKENKDLYVRISGAKDRQVPPSIFQMPRREPEEDQNTEQRRSEY